MERYDFFPTFEALLSQFEALLERARQIESPNPEDTFEIKADMARYSSLRPLDDWSYEHFIYMNEQLTGDLSPESLDWYEDDAAAVRIYGCLAHGALLGLVDSGRVPEASLLLGQAHLVGFIALKDEEICSKYQRIVPEPDRDEGTQALN